MNEKSITGQNIYNFKDHDKDQDFIVKDKDRNQDQTVKEKDFTSVLNESFRTRTRITSLVISRDF